MADCTGGIVACWIASQVDIITNVANSMKPIQRMVTGAAYLIGVLFIVKAIISLKAFGESKTMMSSSHSFKEPMVFLVVGALLLYFPTLVQVLLNTAFGNSEYAQILAYGPISSGSSAINTLFGESSALGAALTVIIQTIGLIAFVRGWVIIAKSASQGQQAGGFGKGMVHVCGGILAMNIIGTLQVINNTLYGT